MTFLSRTLSLAGFSFSLATEDKRFLTLLTGAGHTDGTDVFGGLEATAHGA
jgi:hypothetical protein